MTLADVGYVGHMLRHCHMPLLSPHAMMPHAITLMPDTCHMPLRATLPLPLANVNTLFTCCIAATCQLHYIRCCDEDIAMMLVIVKISRLHTHVTCCHRYIAAAITPPPRHADTWPSPLPRRHYAAYHATYAADSRDSCYIARQLR
jgi:hypothetical protein